MPVTNDEMDDMGPFVAIMLAIILGFICVVAIVNYVRSKESNSVTTTIVINDHSITTKNGTIVNVIDNKAKLERE